MSPAARSRVSSSQTSAAWSQSSCVRRVRRVPAVCARSGIVFRARAARRRRARSNRRCGLAAARRPLETPWRRPGKNPAKTNVAPTPHSRADSLDRPPTRRQVIGHHESRFCRVIQLATTSVNAPIKPVKSLNRNDQPAVGAGMDCRRSRYQRILGIAVKAGQNGGARRTARLSVGGRGDEIPAMRADRNRSLFSHRDISSPRRCTSIRKSLTSSPRIRCS